MAEAEAEVILARSNFDHYARECNLGILKKKNKNKKIFRLCFSYIQKLLIN